MNEDGESSRYSRDLVEYPMKENVDPRERRPQGKKGTTAEDTRIMGPKKKNPTHHHHEHYPSTKRTMEMMKMSFLMMM